MSLTLFTYMRPDEMVTLNQPVTGSVQSGEYQTAWLCDGRPGRPVHSGTVSPSWTVTCSPAADVNLVAAANTNVDHERNIVVSGDVDAILVARRRVDNLPFNPVTFVSPLVASVDSLTVTVTGNSEQVIFGEFFAGKARQLGRPISKGGEREIVWRTVKPGGWSSIPGYNMDQDRQRFTGSMILTQAQMDELEAWLFSTKRGTKPSVIVRTPGINDCMVVDFESFKDTKEGPHEFHVTMNFLEYPRIRWTL